MSQRQAVVFDSAGVPLVGVVEIPSSPRATAVLVVTGGPQYRAGSHRQFALLCRALAARDIVAMTFDYRGSGDSGGSLATFEEIGPDIQAAIDQLCATTPAIRQVVLLGLCDAASAVLMYASSDPRVRGLVLLNPWVRAKGSLERARVADYYPDKLTSSLFWKRLFAGEVNVPGSLKSFFQHFLAARQLRRKKEDTQPEFLLQMLNGAREFNGQVLVVLSGQDMTAQEFRGLLDSSAEWREVMKHVERHEIPTANHTFSSATARDEVNGMCIEFLDAVDRLNQ